MARAVLVTGAESGIGAACAAAFGAEGDRVAIGYYADEDAAHASAAAVVAAGGDAMIVQCHVDSEQSVDRAFGAIEERWGEVSVLVNSAGRNMSGVLVRDMPLIQWQNLLSTDLTGAFLTSRRFLKVRGAGSTPAAIIHISSIHAYAVRAGGADYCAAKGGLAMADPELLAETDATYRQSLERNIPLGRAGNADEVADLAVFLASPKASYITGAQMVIDGGLSLMRGLGA